MNPSFLRPTPVSGHVFRKRRKSGDRWMAKWRDSAGQHQRVLGRSWTGRGRARDGFLTKQGAQRELDVILADARRGQLVAPARPNGGVSFAEAAAEWLRYVEHDRKRRPSTVRDYRIVVDGVLLPAFGEAPLEAITSGHVDAFRACLVAEGRLSARTINKYLALLHGILKRAQRVYGLAANAAAGVERQPVRRSGDFDVLTAAEVEALARAAGSMQDAAVFTTAAYAGLRLGELRALRWRDIDFSKRLVHVRRSYVQRDEGVPKSGRVRSVPMIDQVARELDQLSRRERFTDGEHLVFCNVAGEHFDDSALRRRFYAARERAGLKPIRFHDLRHTFGTLAVQVFPLSDVKAYMGHADIATTMIYVHHVPRVDAAKRLSAALADTVSAQPLSGRRPAAMDNSGRQVTT
ncbi:MAG: site-specific integrase [Solirubrobacterales bacterium]